MFSAIFGNILGYNQTVESEEAVNKFSEASTQTSDNKSTSTQVNLDESKTYNENNNNAKLNDTVNSQQLDWVIVDESETAENEKACGSDDVEMGNSDEAVPQAVDEDPLIGSFFQKHEADQTDKTVETQTVLPQKKETWLITPLPCLTSITESSQQKSMIDNDRLENLLIEQPNRFMSTSTTETTTTTTSTTTTVTPSKRQRAAKKQQKPRETKQQEQLMQSVDANLTDLFKESETPATPVITRTVAEKRKEAEKSASPASPTPSNEYPKKVSRKAIKAMKKNSAQAQKNALNKENMQVKTLLFAECFAKDGQLKNAHGKYNQMSRANKNSALFAMAGNARARKFHNLQQPSMTMPSKNQKF